MTREDTITLRGMQFHVRVGILPHEQEFAQPLEIDLTVWLGAGDDIVDYRDLYQGVAGVLGGGPLHYLEEIGDAIVGGALAHPRVTRARAAVRKPHVSLGGPLAHAEVTVERSREASHGRGAA